MTASLIQRLIHQADMHDKFGDTSEGKLLREAAAALAEANNSKVIQKMMLDILNDVQ